MTYQHQGLEGSSEALEKQSALHREYDKNGQHITHCIFKERGPEPWPKKSLKFILMERYIFLNEKETLKGTWDCPLLGCNGQFNTLGLIIDHLEVCQYLKADTKQYICPGCRAIVEMPSQNCPGCQKDTQSHAMGQGKKTVLKIRDSFENLLVHCSPRLGSRSSSAGSSPISPFSSHYGPSQEKEQAPFTLSAAGNTNFNSQTCNPFHQHNKNVEMESINRSLHPSPMYEMCSNESCISSTTADSSYKGGFYSAFSAPGASSVTSLSQSTHSPAKFSSIGSSCLDSPNVPRWANGPQSPCDVQYSGAVSVDSTFAELPEHAFSHDTLNLEVLLPCFPMDSNLNIPFSDVGKECQGELKSLHQFQWDQQEGSSSMPGLLVDPAEHAYPALQVDPAEHAYPALQVDSAEHAYPALQVDPAEHAYPALQVDPAEHAYPGLQIAISPDLAHDLSSPASTDIAMIDTPLTSDNSSPTTVDGSELQCEICQWEPDKRGKRSCDQLRLAVDKHRKRNHLSRDYQCIVCGQSFKNRQDNVKPHVKRAHPDEFPGIYPDTPAQQDGSQSGAKARAPAKPASRRRESMPTPKSKTFPGRGRQVRQHSR